MTTTAMRLMKLTMSEGVTSDARLFVSEVANASALLILPAMGVNARAYDRFGEALANEGVTTLIAEHRGGDTSSVRARKGVDYGYAELLDDTVIHVDALKQHASGPVSLLGHSLGGQLATVGVSRWHQTGGKLIVIAGGTVHYTAWTGLSSLGVLVGTRFADWLSRAMGYFPGHRIGFGGLQAKTLIVDWAHASKTGEFKSSTRGALELELDEKELEVLGISVRGDTMAPKRTTERLIAKLTRAKTSWFELEPPAQPKKMNPHFRWLKEPETAAKRVARFLRGETA